MSMAVAPVRSHSPSPPPHVGNRSEESALWAPLSAAIERGRNWLLERQRPDGHWCAELQGDTILESEYILLMGFLGREHDDRVRKAANYIVTQQRSGGAWSNYPGGPVDVSVSVKAYFALKLAGDSAEAPYMRRARQLILEHGGAARCNSFTKFYLAFLGQLPYDSCATVPPELMLLPKWAYFNIYAMSSWTRTIVVPLSIFSAHKPVRPIAPERGIAELFVEPPAQPTWPHPPSRRLLTAHNVFLAIDQALKCWERWGPRWVRRRAVAKASAWMRRHFQDSDGVGAIFPPIIYTIISLHCLGYAADSPEMTYALKQLDDLIIEEKDTLRVQPCFSPVWDTALALNALAAAGVPPECDEAIDRAAEWLLEREVRRRGDWSLMNPGVEPAGWFFEYRNGFYPDMDDTAMVLMGLARTGRAWSHCGVRNGHCGLNGAHEAWRTQTVNPQSANGSPQSTLPAVQRGLRWLLAMQNKDGGWAAFDREINREILTKVPFADHNAMLDPSCPDITARVLEALAQFGYDTTHPQVSKALEFIERTQDRRGCWIGRWGVNYLYGTWQVLAGLSAIGYDMGAPLVRRAVAWLESVQQPSGGWGESCKSYDDPSAAGQGPCTASQTGWALLGLLASGEEQSRAVRDGIAYLSRTQQADGSWHEDEFTGTGFPRVFYLKYHYYRVYFPLMALARYRKALEHGRQPDATNYRVDLQTFRGDTRGETRIVASVTLAPVRRTSEPLVTTETGAVHAVSAKPDDDDGRVHGQEKADRREAVSFGIDAGAAARV
jgi:squalene-hopene/tetraprenyl-beta-curcumene cyclase